MMMAVPNINAANANIKHTAFFIRMSPIVVAYELLNGILTPRQLEGLRLLLTPFPEQQFNATEDRKSAMPSLGVACFDCHSNGHQNGAMHLTPDTRPEWFRHRTKTLSLRGVNIQRFADR